METTADSVALNHPDYDENLRHWEFVRHSFAGEYDMKTHAHDREYIIVPQAMLGYSGERAPAYHYVQNNREAVAYIERARYPEVCARALEIASGKALSRDPQIEADDAVVPLLDEVFASGVDFETGVLEALKEALTLRAGGLLVNLNSEGKAAISIYPAENVVNWNSEGGKTRLVVIEDTAPNPDPFNHEPIAERIVLGLDDRGKYFMERWQMGEADDGDAGEWELDDNGRVYPTSALASMDGIPFIPLGGWTVHKAPMSALAETAKSYFRASAEYNHIMWWAATPQPYISFAENGGFYGVDEYDPNAAEHSGGNEVAIRWGASTPILLREGKIDFAAAPTGALAAHEKRMESLRNEMGGLGARAFSNNTNANQTAETERMQQSGEGSVVWLVLREVAKALTVSVRMALSWRGVREADKFEFAFNKDISFEAFDMSAVPGLTTLHQDGYIRKQDVRRYLRKIDVVEPGMSDEDLDAAIAEEGPLGGFGGFDE